MLTRRQGFNSSDVGCGSPFKTGLLFVMIFESVFVIILVWGHLSLLRTTAQQREQLDDLQLLKRTAASPPPGGAPRTWTTATPAGEDPKMAAAVNWSERSLFPEIRWRAVRLKAEHPNRSNTSIAIGCAVTSRGSGALRTAAEVREDMPFFRLLMTSFCATCSRLYRYHFYLAHDVDDPFFGVPFNRRLFADVFVDVVTARCRQPERFFVHFVTCPHSRKPAWAQNDAMMAAYLDGIDYFFRINDDTVLVSSFWTERYIQTLSEYKPPNVGVVGPQHTGGNFWILTYDFVHRTHIDIFGFYYPRVFTDWFADGWITAVYSPNRTTKVTNALLTHETSFGHRYLEDKSKLALKESKIKESRRVLGRYLSAMQMKKINENKTKSEYNVISMSLCTDDEDRLYGVLRNANLVKQFWPEWQLRVYTDQSHHSELYNKIISALLRLGTKMISVDGDFKDEVPSAMWRYLAMDEKDVNYFFIRDADTRLISRDYDVINDFVQSGKSFHCIRDHQEHGAIALIDGLWGGQASGLRQILNSTIKEFILDFIRSRKEKAVGTPTAVTVSDFMDALWERVSAHALCHDSVSCDHWPGSKPFPFRRRDNQYIGAHFTAFGERINDKPVFGRKQCVQNVSENPN